MWLPKMRALTCSMSSCSSSGGSASSACAAKPRQLRCGLLTPAASVDPGLPAGPVRSWAADSSLSSPSAACVAKAGFRPSCSSPATRLDRRARCMAVICKAMCSNPTCMLCIARQTHGVQGQPLMHR